MTRTSTTTRRPRPGRLGAVAMVSLLAAAGMTAAAAPAQATPDVPDNCTFVDYPDATTRVECLVTDSGVVTIADLVPAAIAPAGDAPVVLTARGGAGATLAGDSHGRAGGDGGVARTSATAAGIDRLHVAVGKDARAGSREGGSATIVSDLPIEAVTSIDDTWLIAGGGGAQGVAMWCGNTEFGPLFGGAGSGGMGGFADANHRAAGNPATGHGWNGGAGSSAGCSGMATGHAGTGGDLGVAGVNHGDARSNGIDGIGGHGGTNGWQGDIAADHTAGRGGITSVYAMGGGGYGGGSGGERNGGGGGGGSYARAAADWTHVPRSYGSEPGVTIAWPTDAPTT